MTGAPRPVLHLVCESSVRRAAEDVALSSAVLRRAADGETGDILRLHRTRPAVAFSRLDSLETGYERAVRASLAAGFDPVARLEGGRAAAIHEQTLLITRTVPDPNPMARIDARFRETAELLVRALRRLGVAAEVGEVPGEYCPGGHTINARGKVKLAGLGQRLVGRAAHIGAVVVAGGAMRIREVLLPVYSALDLEWEPDTVGSVGAETGASLPDVEQAIRAELATSFEVVEAVQDATTLALSAGLEEDHKVQVRVR